MGFALLVTTDDLLMVAQRSGYAVGAFDLVSLETAMALLEAAESLRSPIILMVGQEVWALVPHPVLIPAIRQMAEAASVPVAIILDHGMSYEEVVVAIESGATSVMIDGSQLPFDENVLLTQRVVKLAREAHVSVEAEIGHVGEGDPEFDALTTSLLSEPDDVERFLELTGVDALAVAIGTVHGSYRGRPRLDFARLQAIRARVDVPLVLHGGSGTRSEDLRHCIELGISKINIYTDLELAARRELRASLDHGDDLPAWLRAINRGFAEVAAEYLTLFGCAGRA